MSKGLINMKKLLILLLSALSALTLLTVPAYAESNIYKIGIINDYKIQDVDIATYARTCLREVFYLSETSDFALGEYSSDSVIKRLADGTLDFLAMVPRDEALAESIDYTDKALGVGFLSLFVDSNKELYYKDYAQFNGIRIATLHNRVFENMLAQFAEEHNFTYTLVYKYSGADMKRAVADGEADAILLPATSAPEGMRIIAKCGQMDYYCAVAKGNTTALAHLNRLIDRLASSYPFYASRFYMDCFQFPYGNMVAMTETDYNSAKDKGKLRVFLLDSYPMAFYDESTGTYEGVYIDIVDKIIANAGMEVEYIRSDLTNEAQIREDMLLGKADAILCVSGSEQGVTDATLSYTSVTFHPVVREDVDVNSELAVGIVDDDKWIINYLDKDYPRWTIRLYDSINSLLRAAEKGEVDASLLSTQELQTKTSLIAHPKLFIMKDVSIDIPVRLGISRITCDSNFLSMINGIIHNLSVSDAELESQVYTLTHTYIPNFRDMMYANQLWVAIIGVIIAIIMIILAHMVNHFRKLSRIDVLTGVYNSKHLMKVAGKHLARDAYRKHLLISVDAINFKLVNDRFGTDVGDRMLKAMADELKRLFYGSGIFGRLAGDNFLVIVDDNNRTRQLINELEKADIHISDASSYQLYIKAGICPIINYDPNKPLSLYVDRANIAKEDVHTIGKNYLCYFTDEMYEKLEIESELEVDMVASLRNGEFIAYYQPKYDLKTGKIVGAEALVRWNHKDRGLISPGVFVPLFERNGFINYVDFAVYEQAMRMIKKRILNNEPIVPVSMNVSRRHIADKDFADKLDELVKKYKIPKEYIDMEITESIFSDDNKSAKDLVNDLRSRGYAVSMDDFGSGYSSLNLLRIMPIDTLKIDRAFIEDIETSKRSVNIVEEIIAMAKRIDMKTVCEGIETEGQRDILLSAGCDTAQGFYYSRPIPEDAFENLLNKGN